MTRISFLLTSVLIIFISSCSSLMSDFAPTDTYLSIKNYVFGFPSLNISYADYKKKEDSFAVIKFGRGPSSTIYLAYVKNGIYEWRSNDGVKIYTLNGMIVETEGLPHDMRFDSECFQNNASNFITSESCRLTLVNPDLSQAYSKTTPIEESSAKVLRFGKEIEVTQYKMRIEVPSIRWSKQNVFIVDDGDVLSTLQNIHPKLPSVYIEYFLVY